MSTLPPQMIKSSSTVPLSSNINNSVTLGRCSTPISATTSNISHSDNTDFSQKSQKEYNSSSTNSSNASPNKCNTLNSCATSTSGNTVLSTQNSFKGWFIQPACAITGDGLQEGLEALYDMIIKKRKLNKAHKKKR